MKLPIIQVLHKSYRYGIRPLLFRFSSESVHEVLTNTGEAFGKSPIIRTSLSKLLTVNEHSLEQTFFHIPFSNPIGLSAGFDYKAQLTQLTPSLGFGFETIGTITNNPYAGNPKPQLGRLVKSRSLLVNKGFKNEGMQAVLTKLSGKQFGIPVGVSIGRTNSRVLMTQQQSIQDICQAFQKAEQSQVPFSYYELNISCPNLFGDVTFYPPKNLHELLHEITKLKLSKPLFLKMPIEKSNEEVKKMLEVSVQFPVQGVIFGNLQKNRNDPALLPEEVRKYPIGNFSGKPTQKRSDELIEYAYKHYGKRLLIIGCGGVFSAEDAYRKIRLGASLVQLITGLIFEGPQLISEINCGLIRLLRKDGFLHISETIGIDN
jgi:dihydroorotate dehydrogenase